MLSLCKYKLQWSPFVNALSHGKNILKSGIRFYLSTLPPFSIRSREVQTKKKKKDALNVYQLTRGLECMAFNYKFREVVSCPNFSVILIMD